jgi:hypothetical protein
MKLPVFYVLLLVPLTAAIVLYRSGHLHPVVFGGYILLYILVYHPIIAGIRLLKGKKITKKQFMYNFIPGWNTLFFNYLYFGK